MKLDSTAAVSLATTASVSRWDHQNFENVAPDADIDE